MNPIKRFLLACSGADLAILASPECRIEHNQYIGIGAAILSTSIFAAISGGYALYTSFHSLTISLIIGLFWGLTIFNLDRFIVSSMRKPAVPPHLSFREKLQLKSNEIMMATPRLLLAMFISIIIAKPLELKLFENEIDAQLQRNFSRQVIDIQNSIKQEFSETDQLTLRIKDLNQQIAIKDGERIRLRELAFEEAAGRLNGRTTGRRGEGPLYRERSKALNTAEVEYLELKKNNEAQIALANDRLSALKAQQDQRIQETVASIRQATGLMPRLNAFEELTQNNRTVELLNIFLVILFLLLETAPVVVKLLSARGPYDDIHEMLRRRYDATVIETESVSSPDTRDNKPPPPTSKDAARPKIEPRIDSDSQGTTIRRKDPYRLVGATFAGKYLLESYAGGGGMGAVYHAIDLEKKPVAVKILKPDVLERNASYAGLFDREVRAVRRLEHPHIVKIIDSGIIEDEEISFMVMEWLTGETLEKVISHGPLLSLEQITTIFSQVCEAIAYAHENNTIHLDIKPGNIFLIEHSGLDDYAKVIDFGMARILSSETGTTVTR